MGASRWRLWVVAMVLGTGVSCLDAKDPLPAQPLDAHVGLNLDILNGKPQPLVLRAPLGEDPERKFYVQQVRLQVSQRAFPAPDVLDFMKSHSDFSGLDWEGLTTLDSEVEKASSGSTYRETKSYLLAAWMKESPTFTLEFVDSLGESLGDAVTLSGPDFILDRRVAMTWTDGMPTPTSRGPNTGNYVALAVTSGGVFAGAADDVFLVRVAKGGALGTATVDVSAVSGGAPKKGVVVSSGQPIDLDGPAGTVTLTMTDTGSTTLVQGDSWFVRCTAGTGAVAAPAPGTRANYSAMAEFRLSVARRSTPLFSIPEEAAQVWVTWSGRPDKPYVFPVSFQPAPFRDELLDYGLKVEMALSAPANGKYYRPGEDIDVTLDLFDGAGHKLHEDGFFPTYEEFIAGKSNGIQYYRSATFPSGHGFFNEHRLNLMRVAIVGPKQSLSQNYTNQHPTEYVAEEWDLPPVPDIMAGLGNPAKWKAPILNSATLTIPWEAEDGTYVAMAKVARSFLGESVYRIVVKDIQVGTEERTVYPSRAGNCDLCHVGDASLDRLRHGLSQHQLCVACHAPPRGTFAEHLHKIHFMSQAYPESKNNCGACHVKVGSNERASQAVCGACHGEVHADEFPEFQTQRYEACGTVCHPRQPSGNGHLSLAPN